MKAQKSPERPGRNSTCYKVQCTAQKVKPVLTLGALFPEVFRQLLEVVK